MAAIFMDEDFVKACDELDTPNLTGWDLFTQYHGYSIYRLHDQVSGLYHYKSYGSLKDIMPQVCANVFLDIDYRQEWDPYLIEVYTTQDNGTEVTYWQVNFPFPMSNRDYVFRREMRCIDHCGQKKWVALVESIPSSIPERPGVIRVDRFTQKFVMAPDGEFGTRTFMHHFDDPKSIIPPAVFNWMAKLYILGVTKMCCSKKGNSEVAVPRLLKAVEKACRRYPAYQENKPKSSSSSPCVQDH